MKGVCEIVEQHEDVVQHVQQQLPELTKTLQIFKALADETRLNIAFALTLAPKLCVCDVAAIIGSSNATASHHLRYLREHGLAVSEREGKQIYYALADEHVRQMIDVAYTHSKE
ncbi:MAG: metalloregulator ArsR/SmtB family transcription factor [Caryophanon sp.]|nr:metalloregulator ArsR/SmtB family transcription factor [Caryophanon sp.]